MSNKPLEKLLLQKAAVEQQQVGNLVPPMLAKAVFKTIVGRV